MIRYSVNCGKCLVHISGESAEEMGKAAAEHVRKCQFVQSRRTVSKDADPYDSVALGTKEETWT